MPTPVTIIIPTTAAPERRDYLLRSIDSTLTQADADVSVLVVANGDRTDVALLSRLDAMPGVTIVREPVASLPRALEIGRRHVETPLFGEIDDDDVFLPSALRVLQDALAQDPDADAVIGNALLRQDGAPDITSIPDVEQVQRDPFRALLRANWMVPGSALYRADRVPPAAFANIPRFLEWTYLATLLCLDHAVSFVAEPVVVHHLGHPFSIDASREAPYGRVTALNEILGLSLPRDIRRLFRRKLAAAFHHCSSLCLEEREMGRALGFHLGSLCYPGGWRYLPYSRYLLTPSQLATPKPRRGAYRRS